jgi:hypothetical protein
MRYKILFFLSFLVIPFFANAQGLFLLDVNSTIVATKNPERTLGLVLDTGFEEEILSKNLSNFNLTLPFFGTELEMKAVQFKVYADNFQIISLTDKGEEYLEEKPTIQSYKLLYEGKSIGVINFFNNEIVATFKFEGRQYEIAKHKESYILFESSNSINSSNFSCAVDEEFMNTVSPQIESSSSVVTSVCIELAIEVDNYTRNTFSSTLETTNWALAIIAGVSQIYDTETNTAVVVVYSYIWNTADPYNSYINQSSNMLSGLASYWMTNNGTVIRDLVHLMTKRSNTGTGGIAYLDVLCDNSWGYGFSSALDNDTTYTFPNPSYTWNLTVVSHEIGHNVGAHHTHWCGWVADPFIPFAGGIIDNCVDVQGSCANNPTPQLGTIMSYCHTTSGGLVLDFHDVVVSQALNPGITSASCLTTCDYYGCTDSTAFNYNPNANVDDGSCISKVFGCIDTAAANFNPLANVDDGSCTYCSALSFIATDVSCNGFNDGVIDLNVQNGIAPFTYSWTGPNGFTDSNEDISGIEGGMYIVIVTDGFGCSETSSIQIIDPNPITISGIATTNVSCYGLNNGTVSVMAAGGFTPYTFDYGTANPNALSQGLYNVTVTDSNNCPSATSSFVIIEPGDLMINAIPTNVSCNGFNDGSILVSVSGGSFPFSFSWSGPNSFSSPFQNINNLVPGNYNLYLVDANGCTASYSVLISEPNLLNATVMPANVSCNNGTDGVINLFPTGGTQPYSFVWNNGSSLQNQINVSAGNYFVSVADDNGCNLPIINVLLTEPPASVVNSIITDVDCFGNATAAIDVSYFPSSSVNQFSYSWVGPNSYTSATEDISNIEAGLYILTVLENGICNKVASYMVNEPALISVIENIQDVSCFGGSDAVVNLAISGGVPIYSTDWAGQNPQALPIGSYLYTVTDQNNCIYTNTVTISQPSQSLSVNNSVTAVSCNNGSDAVATLFISGGTSPYSSVWPNTNPMQLNAGYHTFITSDTNGCLFEDSVLVLEPTALQITELTTDVLCFGESTGTANLLLNGATSPYTVDWQGASNNALSAGNYMYDVEDNNGCIISGVLFISQPSAIAVQNTILSSTCPQTNDGSVINIVSGGVAPYNQNWNGVNPLALASGNYNFTILDANLCIDSNQVYVSSVSDIEVFELVNNASCNDFCDGDVSLLISNGITPYQVLWFNGAQADSLCAGIYTYQITDNLSCVSTDTVKVSHANPIILTVTQQTNMLLANTAGGTQPYFYNWWNSNGVIGVSQGRNILQSGNYNCVVYDANNCNSDTITFKVSETGINDLSINEITVYPNPSSSYLNIDFPYPFKAVAVEITDVLGRILIKQQFYKDDKVQINVNSLAAGSYYVLIKTADLSIQKKIIIQ